MARDDTPRRGEWGIFRPKQWQREKGLTGEFLTHNGQVVAILHSKGELFFPRGEQDLRQRQRVDREGREASRRRSR